MKRLGDYIQEADWKKEKHVPVIECPDTVKAGELLQVKASVGKEIKHPNTTEHHIRWIRLFFQPEGGNIPILLETSSFVHMVNQPRDLTQVLFIQIPMHPQ